MYVCVNPRAYEMFLYMLQLLILYSSSHVSLKRFSFSCNSFVQMNGNCFELTSGNTTTCNSQTDGRHYPVFSLLIRGCNAQLLYEQLRHMDIRHFVILECRHLANGCVLKCGCIGLMLFRNLSCLGTIICYINTIGIVPAYACNVCDALVASYTTTG